MDDNKKHFWKTLIIAVLVLIGIGVTIDLAYIYYQANFNEHALPSFCSVNDFIDCDGVARTVESQFLGVPLAYWGLFLYVFMGIMLMVDGLKKIPFLKFLEVFKNKFHYIAALGLISFLISMTLFGISYFEIKKLCVMCLVTYLLNFLIGLVAAAGLQGHFIGAVRQSWVDFVDALKPLPYRIAFILVMALACGFFSWTFSSAKFSPALKGYRAFGEFLKLKSNIYAVKGNVLGSPDKDAVVLEVYSDYMCPICYTCNIMVHKVVTEFKNVRVEHHNMPLDKACNKYMREDFHIGSCVSAKYGLAAEKQGKFWEVESLLFDKPATTEEEVIKNLKESGIKLDFDKLKKDANSKEIADAINKDIDYAFSKGMVGTPSMKVGDKFDMGVKPYPELKKWLIENGAKPKYKFF
ncbi:DsbA family protein [bacterium]|nr:DsbA family protein [bacterium]